MEPGAVSLGVETGIEEARWQNNRRLIAKLEVSKDSEGWNKRVIHGEASMHFIVYL